MDNEPTTVEKPAMKQPQARPAIPKKTEYGDCTLYDKVVEVHFKGCGDYAPIIQADDPTAPIPFRAIVIRFKECVTCRWFKEGIETIRRDAERGERYAMNAMKYWGEVDKARKGK